VDVSEIWRTVRETERQPGRHSCTHPYITESEFPDTGTRNRTPRARETQAYVRSLRPHLQRSENKLDGDDVFMPLLSEDYLTLINQQLRRSRVQATYIQEHRWNDSPAIATQTYSLSYNTGALSARNKPIKHTLTLLQTLQADSNTYTQKNVKLCSWNSWTHNTRQLHPKIIHRHRSAFPPTAYGERAGYKAGVTETVAPISCSSGYL
jgi:hypothetical protein